MFQRAEGNLKEGLLVVVWCCVHSSHLINSFCGSLFQIFKNPFDQRKQQNKNKDKFNIVGSDAFPVFHS